MADRKEFITSDPAQTPLADESHNSIDAPAAPILFLIFNRPETTRRVWEAIRNARPATLLVVADGPRPDRPGETDRCREARAVTEQIDWRCDVQRNYSEHNLGCRGRVASGIRWAIEQVERAIILEDDCLPHPSFFPWCAQMLERFSDDPRIFTISGANFLGRDPRRVADSYYFSRYPQIWGWATWRRAMVHYDPDMKSWPSVRERADLRASFHNDRLAAYWTQVFDAVYQGEIDTWDVQLLFTQWLEHGLSVTPAVNLVSNIGFGPTATHTSVRTPYAELPLEEMRFPLQHPPFVIRDAQADAATERLVFLPASLPIRAMRKLVRGAKSFFSGS